jgi:hypothetical protein
MSIVGETSPLHSLTCEMGEQAAHACVIADYNGFRDSGVSTNRVGLNPNSF